jgi:hypothetical protein
MPPIAQTDTSKSLAELSGVDWGPPPAGASELARERHELRRRPIRDLSTEELRRFLDMGCDATLLVPIALERSDVSESLALLCALLRVRDYDWRGHAEVLEAVRHQVYRADNLLSQIEGDLDTLATQVAIWRLYAEFERDLPAPPSLS